MAPSCIYICFSPLAAPLYNIIRPQSYSLAVPPPSTALFVLVVVVSSSATTSSCCSIPTSCVPWLGECNSMTMISYISLSSVYNRRLHIYNFCLFSTEYALNLYVAKLYHFTLCFHTKQTVVVIQMTRMS